MTHWFGVVLPRAPYHRRRAAVRIGQYVRAIAPILGARFLAGSYRVGL